MSVAVNINIRDGATPALAAKVAKAQPHTLATQLAPPLARHWRNHLVGLPRNKHGYPSTGFWEDAARRVTGVALGGTVVLSSDKLGLRKRLYGGPVKAVNVANLTIPICAEAYGTTVKDWGFENLTLVILGDGRKFLALWLGSEERRFVYQSKFGSFISGYERRKAAGKIQTRAHEALTKRVGALMFGGSGHPKVIVFKRSSGATIARTERHADLKFLFRLMPETGDQAPMPQVIPPDLGDLARQLVMEAVK